MFNITRTYNFKGDTVTQKLIFSTFQIKDAKDICINGNGYAIKGNNKAVHLLVIHNSKNVTIKNLQFYGGNTDLIKLLPRKNIPFRKQLVSIFEIIDGGAVLITGDSTVHFENCQFINNNSLLCGGAISNQSKDVVRFTNCRFENNHAGHTGSAIDNLTKGSKIIVNNCNFINNKSNVWNNNGGPNGQISLFPETYAEITNCIFEGDTIPIDYYPDTNLVFTQNHYSNEIINKEKFSFKRNHSLYEYLKAIHKLYWILPKTIGKVRYKVN